jgi:hypothetical protein
MKIVHNIDWQVDVLLIYMLLVFFGPRLRVWRLKFSIENHFNASMKMVLRGIIALGTESAKASTPHRRTPAPYVRLPFRLAIAWWS